jgi:hypothetical protein
VLRQRCGSKIRCRYALTSGKDGMEKGSRGLEMEKSPGKRWHRAAKGEPAGIFISHDCGFSSTIVWCIGPMFRGPVENGPKRPAPHVLYRGSKLSQSSADNCCAWNQRGGRSIYVRPNQFRPKM